MVRDFLSRHCRTCTIGAWYRGVHPRQTAAAIIGIVTGRGLHAFAAEALVLTTGTFLDGGACTAGLERSPRAGASGNAPQRQPSIAASFLGAGPGDRPPQDGHSVRVSSRRWSIDFAAVLEPQPGDDPPPVPMSFRTRKALQVEQMPCHLTWTKRASRTRSSARTLHQLARCSWGAISGRRSALLPLDRGQGGSLRGEDNRTRSSSSRRRATARRSTRTGFRRACRRTCRRPSSARMRGIGEHAQFARHGYAVEYTYVPPRQLQPHAGDEGRGGSLHGGADQRDVRLRGGRRARASSPGINAALKLPRASAPFTLAPAR
jgi:tRNA uridine 5-carboxymethylaminomethyl modification enzyme